MKKTLTILALLSAFSASAQFNFPIATPTWNYTLRVADPSLDTLHSKAIQYPGLLQFRQQAGDTGYYFSNGKRMVKLGGGTTVTASNGLSMVGGDVRLGGILTAPYTYVSGENARLNFNLSSGMSSTSIQINPTSPETKIDAIYGTTQSSQNIQSSGVVTTSSAGTTPNEARVTTSVTPNAWNIITKLPTETAAAYRLIVAGGVQQVSLRDYQNTGTIDSVLTTDTNGRLIMVHKNTLSTNYWTASGNNIYNSNTGNVGIGTSNPQAKLHIVSHLARIQGLAAGDVNTAGWEIFDNGGFRKGFFGDASSANADMYVLSESGIRLQTGGTERVHVSGIGNVGIGVTDPTVKLDVAGAGNFSGTLKIGGTATLPAISATGNNLPLSVSGSLEVMRLLAGSSSRQVAVNSATAAATLDINGSLATHIRSANATTTLAETDHTLVMNNAGAAAIVNLPSAAGAIGRIYVIKKASGASLDVTIDPNASELIDNNSTYSLTSAMSSVTIQSDGTAWWVIAH